MSIPEYADAVARKPIIMMGVPICGAVVDDREWNRHGVMETSRPRRRQIYPRQ